MANNLTLEDINNLYFWATKLEEEPINDLSYENIESKEDILNLTNITARNSLPKEVFKLNRLKSLRIWVDDLTELPKEIGNLTNLKGLRIECPNLNELPKEIGNLNNLGWLQIYCHNLKELPKEIWNLSEFEVEFDIKNNNNKELLKYIVDSPNNENKDVELKIVIKEKKRLKNGIYYKYRLFNFSFYNTLRLINIKRV